MMNTVFLPPFSDTCRLSHLSPAKSVSVVSISYNHRISGERSPTKWLTHLTFCLEFGSILFHPNHISLNLNTYTRENSLLLKLIFRHIWLVEYVYTTCIHCPCPVPWVFNLHFIPLFSGSRFLSSFTISICLKVGCLEQNLFFHVCLILLSWAWAW